MKIFLLIFLAVAILYIVLEKLNQFLNGIINEKKPLPYILNKSILTKTELKFYNFLTTEINNNKLILLKVSLKDIFHIKKGIGKDYLKYFNKISQKRVDFLICDRTTLKPLFAIELDDSSHLSIKRKERDAFIDRLYSHAKLELIHVPVKNIYSSNDIILKSEIPTNIIKVAPNLPHKESLQEKTLNRLAPICPKCGVQMILRMSKRGKNKGQEFYGCSNFPNCRGLVTNLKTTNKWL